MIKIPKYTKAALSNTEIERYLLQYNTKYLNYNDLRNYTRLIDLFEGGLPFRVIFLENEFGNMGHWVCLININDKTFEYFDSEGLSPDGHDSFMVDKKNYFKDIIKQSKERLIYSGIVLQNKKSIACGYWVINRINAIKLSMPSYYDLINHISKAIDLDDWVVLTTLILSD